MGRWAIRWLFVYAVLMTLLAAKYASQKWIYWWMSLQIGGTTRSPYEETVAHVLRTSGSWPWVDLVAAIGGFDLPTVAVASVAIVFGSMKILAIRRSRNIPASTSD